MLVPQFWAEASARHREGRKQITVRRFGWSDESEQAAQAHADERAQEALILVMTGAKLARREPKVAYNGAEGVPIREEILERHGDVVITRNQYGARCLNTPDVLFADIDFENNPAPAYFLVVAAVAGVLGLAIGRAISGFGLGLVLMFAGLLSAYSIANSLSRLRTKVSGGPERQALARIESFLRQKPQWRVRLYRTPAGLRVLALHRRFDPAEPEVGEFFNAVRADRIYVRMCLNQRCFRARLSPKPWRIGMGSHIKPRPGIWPVKPERQAERNQWNAKYEAAAQAYAACALVGDLGSGAIDAGAEAVRELHDRECRAESGLPLA